MMKPTTIHCTFVLSSYEQTSTEDQRSCLEVEERCEMLKRLVTRGCDFSQDLSLKKQRFKSHHVVAVDLHRHCSPLGTEPHLNLI
jgi:hypothetical protein